jgi:hypothetical protein
VFRPEPDFDPNEYQRWQALADKGDPNAEYHLAIYGCRVNRDGEAMLEWLRKSAAQM